MAAAKQKPINAVSLRDAVRLPWWLWLFLLMPAFNGILNDSSQLGADILIYGLNIVHFSEQLFAGDWYPQWADKMDAGIGNSTLTFYAPIPQYIGSFFMALFREPPLGIRAVYATMFFAHTVFSLGVRYLLLQLFDREEANLATPLAVINPFFFHLYYVSSNHSTFVFLAFAPWILVSLNHWQRTHDVKGLAFYALCSSAALLSHPLYSMIFLPLAFAYGLLLFRTVKERALLAIAAILSFGMASFFTIPAWTNKIYFLFREHFLSGNLSYLHNFTSYEIYFLHCIESPLLLVLILAGIQWKKLVVRERYFLCCSVLILLMITPFSIPIWTRVSLLQYLQFPSRFYSLFLLFVVPVFVSSLRHYPRMRPFIYNSLWGTYAPLMLFFGYSLYITAMDPAYIHRLEQLRPNPWTQFLTPQNKELITAHEYKNYVMPKEENMLPLLDKYKTYAPITFLKGAGKTDIQHWESKGTRFVVDVRSAEAQLRLRRSYTPGWSATDEGKPITLKPTNPEGFIEMTLPKGIHSIKMTYVPNNYPIAKYISLASLAGLLLCCAINRKTKRKI